MIVDPDFLDHWRTRMVVDALGGDELAPTYLLRLWAHCQTRKSDRFAMPPAGLKAQCRYRGDAMALEKALTDAGFVCREGDTLHVLGWAEQNASLLAAWENGGKGGRPPKPREYPRVQDEEPTGNPEETQGKPDANPDETDKRRVDKTREGERRATRIPPNFEPEPEPEAERGIDRDTELANFRDYWTAKSGKDATKLDWQATWRTWARKAHRRPADVARTTVPSKSEPDPELERIKSHKGSKPAPEVQARMDAILKGRVYQ